MAQRGGPVASRAVTTGGQEKAMSSPRDGSEVAGSRAQRAHAGGSTRRTAAGAGRDGARWRTQSARRTTADVSRETSGRIRHPDRRGRRARHAGAAHDPPATAAARRHRRRLHRSRTRRAASARRPPPSTSPPRWRCKDSRRSSSISTRRATRARRSASTDRQAGTPSSYEVLLGEISLRDRAAAQPAQRAAVLRPGDDRPGRRRDRIGQHGGAREPVAHRARRARQTSTSTTSSSTARRRWGC